MPMTTQRFLQIVAIIIVVVVGVLAVQHYQECQQPPEQSEGFIPSSPQMAGGENVEPPLMARAR
jgi:hypothetical protein